jgi:hypothetical protein
MEMKHLTSGFKSPVYSHQMFNASPSTWSTGLFAPVPPSVKLRFPMGTTSKNVEAADVARAASQIVARMFGSLGTLYPWMRTTFVVLWSTEHTKLFLSVVALFVELVNSRSTSTLGSIVEKGCPRFTTLRNHLLNRPIQPRGIDSWLGLSFDTNWKLVEFCAEDVCGQFGVCEVR